MLLKATSRNICLLTILLINISCDQISKSIIRKELIPQQEITVIPNHITLTHVENSGAFLSLGSSLPSTLKFILLSLIPAGVLITALIFLFTQKQIGRSAQIALCFVVGGGLGNLYDRIFRGSVTDFLHIDFMIFQTGIFNLADVSIMTGIALFLFSRSGQEADSLT